MSQLTYRASGLPPGMQLSSSGILSGISSDIGRYDFTITARDNITNKTLTQKYTAIIGSDICSSESIDSIPHLADPTNYTVGYPIQPNIIFTPLGNNRWFLSSDTLPPGLVLDGNGLLSGTPTKTGTYHFEVNVNTYFGCNYSEYYTINVKPQLTFSAISRDITFASDTIPLPPQYTFAFSPSSDVSAVSFVSSDNTSGQFRFQGAGLPPGTVLNSLTGQLSGIVSDVGTYGFSITARNINTNESLTQDYTAVISTDTCSPVSISSIPILTNLTIYTVGIPIQPNIIFTPIDPQNRWYISNNYPLPPGLTLNPTGILFGTPTQVGTYTFQINLTTSSGCRSSAYYTIQIVSQQRFASYLNNLPGASDTILLPENFTFYSSNTSDIPVINFISSDFGSQYYTASNLPSGIILNPTTGQLNGLVSDIGKFDFSVSKRNLYNNSLTTQNYSIIISSDTNPPPQPTSSDTYSPSNSITSIPFLLTPVSLTRGIPIQEVVFYPNPYYQYFTGMHPNNGDKPNSEIIPGVILSVDGILSGIPTQTGTYNTLVYNCSPYGKLSYAYIGFNVSD